MKNIAKQEPKRLIGAKPLLFDRLVDLEPEIMHESHQILTFDGVLRSVVIEVARILNTRQSARKKVYEQLSKNSDNFGLPIMFGIPDFTSLDPADKKQRWRICLICERALSVFEPRLKQIKVIVERFDQQKQHLYVQISGVLALQKIQDKVTFPILIDYMNFE